jgi:hypothetical protein
LSYKYSNFKNIYINIITNYEFLPRSEQETLLECFNHRKDFMFHEVQLAAHLLNPKIGNTFIIDYAQATGLDKNRILQDLGEYCGKQSLWDDPLIWEAATCTY